MRLHIALWVVPLATISVGLSAKIGSVAHARSAGQVYSQSRCGGVSAQWRPFDAPPGDLEPLENKVEVDGSGLRWNGKKTSQSRFKKVVGMASALVPQPRTLVLIHDNAICGKVIQIRTMLERNLHCSAKQACTEFSEKEWA